MIMDAGPVEPGETEVINNSLFVFFEKSLSRKLTSTVESEEECLVSLNQTKCLGDSVLKCVPWSFDISLKHQRKKMDKHLTLENITSYVTRCGSTVSMLKLSFFHVDDRSTVAYVSNVVYSNLMNVNSWNKDSFPFSLKQIILVLIPELY